MQHFLKISDLLVKLQPERGSIVLAPERRYCRRPGHQCVECSLRVGVLTPGREKEVAFGGVCDGAAGRGKDGDCGHNETNRRGREAAHTDRAVPRLTRAADFALALQQAASGSADLIILQSKRTGTSKEAIFFSRI